MSRKQNSLSAMLGLLTLLVVLLSNASQAQISVVVSKTSKHTADASELKQLFTGSKVTWSDGEKAVIIEQTNHKSFYESFIGRQVSQVRNDWTKLVLSGQANAPKKYSDDESAKKAVVENSNAVGFISTGSLDDSVKEIYRVLVLVKN